MLELVVSSREHKAAEEQLKENAQVAPPPSEGKSHSVRLWQHHLEANKKRWQEKCKPKGESAIL